jgi:hypothetical protein
MKTTLVRYEDSAQEKGDITQVPILDKNMWIIEDRKRHIRS